MKIGGQLLKEGPMGRNNQNTNNRAAQAAARIVANAKAERNGGRSRVAAQRYEDLRKAVQQKIVEVGRAAKLRR